MYGVNITAFIRTVGEGAAYIYVTDTTKLVKLTALESPHGLECFTLFSNLLLGHSIDIYRT